MSDLEELSQEALRRAIAMIAASLGRQQESMVPEMMSLTRQEYVLTLGALAAFGSRFLGLLSMESGYDPWVILQEHALAYESPLGPDGP